MSIETLLEAAKFVEWSSQVQHSAREDNDVHQVQKQTNKTPSSSSGIQQRSPACTAAQPTHHMTPTTSPPPHPIAIHKSIINQPSVTSPRPQEAPWKSTSHTSPRPLEKANRPLPHQVIPPHRTPPRALTPPASGASFSGVHQYRPLAPLPSSQSPNGSAQSYVSYSRLDSFDSNSNQSTESRGSDDKKTDTREVHNKLEKNRRAHLKDCFDNLKAQVPNMEDKKIKTSNLSILQGALRYLQALKRKERELEHQLDKLARQKITYQQRLAKLKMEKRLTEDQLPWNRKEESEEEMDEVERHDDDDQGSTSTASEAEEEERKSRAQSPELPLEAQPAKQSMSQGQSKQQSMLQGQQLKQQLSLVQGQSKQQSVVQGQSQRHQPRNCTAEHSPKMMHSITKEIHSGPYVISRQIITHMAQQTSQTTNRPQRKETLPLLSQLARKQAGKPMIGAFEERRSGIVGKGLYPASFGLANVNNPHSSSQSETLLPVAMQPLNSQSANRQTVSQLLGKQTPGVRAPIQLSIPGNHTPVIQAPQRYPLVQGAAYPLVTLTTAPSTATVATIASKQSKTTLLASPAGSRPSATSVVVYTTSTVTTKSVNQPSVVSSAMGLASSSTLRPISPAIPGAPFQSPQNRVTIANAVPTAGVSSRPVAQPFLSPLAMQPSGLTQVLFTQPPVAAYSLAQTQLPNPLIPSALPQTVIRQPTVAMTTVTQSVITQIISTQPMTTMASGKVPQMTTQTITTPAIASMVPGVTPYHSLAALGVAPYPVTLGPPLALNKALVTSTQAYTTLPLGSAALQKLSMSSLPFQTPTIPITAGGTQAAILSPITGLAAPPPPPAVGKAPSVPITTPMTVTTTVSMMPPVHTQAIRPRVSVDPSTLKPASAVMAVPVAGAAQPVINSGVRLVAPKSSGVRISVPSKEKQQGVTTSQMAQIIAASSKNVVTNVKSQVAPGTKPSPSNPSKQVVVNQ